MLGHCGRAQQPMIATAIRQIFQADDGEQARERLTEVVDRLNAPAPKVARLLEDAAEDLLGFYSFPKDHWPKLRSTNPLERVNKEVGRRSDVVGIYPNDKALIRLAGMLLLEQNDEWLVQRRYLSDHSLRQVLTPLPGENEYTPNEKEQVMQLSAA
jgi:transposase-like protein